MPELTNKCSHIALFAVLVVSMASCNTFSSHSVTNLEKTTAPAPWTNLNFDNDPQDFQFAIVADRTAGFRPGVFEDAVQKLNLLHPEFVMSVGDLVQGYLPDEAELVRQWDEFDAMANQFTMPFFRVPGNHDMSSTKQEEIWRTRFGKSFYSFVYKDVLFLCLNTEDPYRTDSWSSISEAQMDMIKRALEENPNPRWIFAFMHRPIWAKCPEARPDLWEPIEKLLEGKPHTVIAGHNHMYGKHDVNGLEYYTLGVTGGMKDFWGTTYGAVDQVMWVAMNGGKPDIVNLTLDGILKDDFILSKDCESVMKLQGVKNNVDVAFSLPAYSDSGNGSAMLILRNDSRVEVSMNALMTPTATLALLPGSLDVKLAPQSEQRVKLAFVTPNGGNRPALDSITGIFTVAHPLPSGESAPLRTLTRTFFVGESEALGRGKNYLFDGASLEGWTMEGMSKTALTNDGDIHAVCGEFNTDRSDAFMLSPAGLTINARCVDKVAVCLKNESNANGIDLYWITDKDAAWGANNKVINIGQKPNSRKYVRYVIETQDNEAWKDTITQFRVDVGRLWGGAALAGKTSVDSITMVEE